jgi:hypothetical protein
MYPKQIRGSHDSGLAEESSLMGCDAVSLGTVVVSSSPTVKKLEKNPYCIVRLVTIKAKRLDTMSHPRRNEP